MAASKKPANAQLTKTGIAFDPTLYTQRQWKGQGCVGNIFRRSVKGAVIVGMQRSGAQTPVELANHLLASEMVHHAVVSSDMERAEIYGFDPHDELIRCEVPVAALQVQ